MKGKKVDVEGILKLADELGIKYELNSDTPGFYVIGENGNERKVTIEEILCLGT